MLSKSTLERRLLEFLRPHWKLFLMAAAASVGLSATSLSVGVFGKELVDALQHGNRHVLAEMCFTVVGIYFVRWFLSMGQNIWFGEVSQRVGVAIRIRLYTHLQGLSLAYFDSQRTGNLLSTFSNDVPVLQGGLMALKDLISSPILAIGGFAVILFISWQLTLICVVILPLMALAIDRISKKLRAISLETQNRLGEVTTMTEETLAGARLVRAFSAEQREIARFKRGVTAAKDITMSGIRRSALLSPTTDFIGACGVGIAMWIGGLEVIHGGSFTAGSLLFFVYTLDRIRTGVSGFGSIAVTWKQTLGAAERIFGNVLDVPAQVVDEPDAEPLVLTAGSVAFSNVCFGYRKDQTVLRGITFDMRPGQVTAIVGPSGAGKSTLADLIPRFYDPTSGSILIDGQDIHQVTVQSLRHHIGIVPQETIIFGGTVRENISYGMPEATFDEIVQAAKHANAHDFIELMPYGYDTIVGERGVMLSGGQRQRIAIARALLKNPRILILDEATSSLDEGSQVLVQEALETLMQGRTTLVIAHRLSTIKNADQIVVMDEGRIVESGSHSQLLRLNGHYARLYETQFRSAGDVIGEVGAMAQTA